MKIFLAAKNKTLDRETAIGLAAINLAATPGLGTILAGRFLVGSIQLLFALAGFTLIIHFFYVLFRNMINGSEEGGGDGWKLGLILFGIGWVLSLITSLQLLRAVPSKKPPRLHGTPG